MTLFNRTRAAWAALRGTTAHVRALDAAKPAPRRELPRFGSVNAEVAVSSGTIVSRSRGLYHNGGLPKNGIDTTVAAVWGAEGARPVGVRRRAAARWADEYRRQNLAAKIRTMILEMAVSGEGFGVMNGADLAVIPREQVDTYSDGRNLINGVRVDDLGRPVAYRVFQDGPDSASGRPAIEVDAGDVLHLFRVDAAGQLRGLPWLTAAMLPASELGAVLDAVTVRARALASVVMVHRQELGAENPQEFSLQDLDTPVIPGSVIHLPPGEAIDFPQTQMPGEIAAVTALRVREIAAALGVPPFMVDGDFGAINYSSARAAMLIFRARVEAVQHMILRPQLDKLWTRITGAEPPSEWLFQPLPAVDPQKQLIADKLELELGLTSRRRLAAERGWSLEDLDAELAAEGWQPAAPKESPNAA